MAPNYFLGVFRKFFFLIKLLNKSKYAPVWWTKNCNHISCYGLFICSTTFDFKKVICFDEKILSYIEKNNFEYEIRIILIEYVVYHLTLKIDNKLKQKLSNLN